MHNYVLYQSILFILLTVVIQFLRNASSAVESDGVIDFTLISSAPSDTPFIVQVCTRETNPRSAEGISLNYV